MGRVDSSSLTTKRPDTRATLKSASITADSGLKLASTAEKETMSAQHYFQKQKAPSLSGLIHAAAGKELAHPITAEDELHIACLGAKVPVS